jgi:MFS family permease
MIPLLFPSLFSPLVGALADKHGTRLLASLGFLSALPTLILLRFITHHTLTQIVLLCILLFLTGCSVTLISVPLMAEISHVVSDEEVRTKGKSASALAYGIGNCAFAVGTLVGPVWGGMVVEHAGWGTMGWSLGLLCGITTLPAILFLGKKST